MAERLDICYRKKNLVSSFLLYSFSLIFWLAIYFGIMFPRVINPHPNVNAILALLLSLFMTAIFLHYAIKFIRVLWNCVSVYRSAPSPAYFLNSEGVTAVIFEWHLPWSEIKEVASSVKNEEIYVRDINKKWFFIYCWGVDKEEIERAKKFIKAQLGPVITKRLK